MSVVFGERLSPISAKLDIVVHKYNNYACGKSGARLFLPFVSIEDKAKEELMTEFRYDPKSLRADEFICHEEILDSIAYADAHKDDIELCRRILDKARANLHPSADHGAVITHREASVLLACEDPQINKEIKELARQIKLAYYGNRIVLFAPLYLSNYCVNGCLYCPYHAKNRIIPRRKLTQEEIRDEVIALQDMGHKRLAIEAGEDPKHNPIEYILESMETIYSIKHRNGAIRRVNVNIAATTVEEYRMLKEAEIGTYILFQETYNKKGYQELHPTGPKSNYDWHTEAMDRAMEGGIDDVGLGVLFGLQGYRYEFAGLIMHAEHLEAVHGVGPHTISVPRVSLRWTSTLRCLTTAFPTRYSRRSLPLFALPCPIPA